MFVIGEIHAEGCAQGGYRPGKRDRAPGQIGLHHRQIVFVGEVLDESNILGVCAIGGRELLAAQVVTLLGSGVPQLIG